MSKDFKAEQYKRLCMHFETNGKLGEIPDWATPYLIAEYFHISPVEVANWSKEVTEDALSFIRARKKRGETSGPSR